MESSPDRRRHKLVIHYADGHVIKGNTYKLDPKARGFYLIPVDPLPGEPEVYVHFSDLKSVFYVKEFKGGQKAVRETGKEYIPEGHEITVKFADGETIHGFAFDYEESSPRFIVDVPDAKDNNYALLVERANTKNIILGRVFRVKKLRRLIDTPVKMLLLKYYWNNMGAVIAVKALAEKIERTEKIVCRDIQALIDERLMEWVGNPEGETLRFLPVSDEGTKEFIIDKLRVLK